MNPQVIRNIVIEGQKFGSLNLNKTIQGSKGNDDFILRVGLITIGENKLKGIKKMFAPTWLKNLFQLSRNEEGIGKVQFYNFFSDSRLKGRKRIHPSSKLINEKFLEKIQDSFKYQFDTLLNDEILGIWIGTDGDDTKSNFELLIKKIVINSKQF